MKIGATVRIVRAKDIEATAYTGMVGIVIDTDNADDGDSFGVTFHGLNETLVTYFWLEELEVIETGK
jgi:hypothetical protein